MGSDDGAVVQVLPMNDGGPRAVATTMRISGSMGVLMRAQMWMGVDNGDKWQVQTSVTVYSSHAT